ncbi:MAG: META domain-containing protein [Gammaproteobacteria bacterium]
MKKSLITLPVLAAVALAVGYYADIAPAQEDEQHDQGLPQSYKNATYIIEGRPISLVNGLSEVEVTPGLTGKMVTRYFGNEIRHDFNGDGREDVAFLLTQQRGGSGTFYYVVAALNLESGYVGSQGYFLGDRIAPQTTEMSRDPRKKNVIVVNYAERAPGESFTVRPSIGKSVWLLLDPETMQFGKVVQDFEGEADPSRMTLGMKPWTWIFAVYNDGKKITPNQPGKFIITFSSDGKFSATTDCNSISGNYQAVAKSISFGPIASTRMHCEGSQETDFIAFLKNAQSYHFTSKGELILDLKHDSETVVFR